MAKPPVAKQVPYRTETHGDVRVDNYFWLREKDNPEVIAHLKAENSYTEAMLADVSTLRGALYEEMKARIKEDDSGVPYKHDDYYYYSRVKAGHQYALFCRKHRSLDAPEEILLDGNVLAEGQAYFSLGAAEVSPDHQWLAYSVDRDGSEKYTLVFMDLRTRKLSPESIPNTAGSVEWAQDNRTVFYSLLDENQRPDRLYRHVVGENVANDVLIHKETDLQLFVGCSKSRSERFLFLEISGKVTSEIRYLDARHPTGEFKMIEPRKRGVLYEVDHHGERFFILTNDVEQNFRLCEAPVASPGAANWKELRRGSPEIFLESISAFRDHLIISERSKGLPQIRVLELRTNKDHLIEFPEPSYELGGQINAEFETSFYRFSYTSLVTPNTVFDYDLKGRTFTTRKVQEIPSGYDKSKYRAERLTAISPDGTKVPISLCYRVNDDGTDLKRDGSRPLYLYAYGSYGLSTSPAFSTTRLSLLDRGFVFAMAHIRGGSEMGRQWYEDGKFLLKKNTFVDLVATAEHLVREGYSKKGEIALVGGSAGGMLVGAVLNERPDLFKAAAAIVPFVDVLNTMLDDTLPLTQLEYEEWGNPNDPVYYEYIKSYSPYDNVKRQAYPNLLVTSGLNDPRVTYWEPAKWVAKLREMKTDANLLLQHINMEAGHGGPSGRYEALKEVALEYSFLLKVFGRTGRKA